MKSKPLVMLVAEIALLRLRYKKAQGSVTAIRILIPVTLRPE